MKAVLLLLGSVALLGWVARIHLRAHGGPGAPGDLLPLAVGVAAAGFGLPLAVLLDAGIVDGVALRTLLVLVLLLGMVLGLAVAVIRARRLEKRAGAGTPPGLPPPCALQPALHRHPQEPE